MNLFPDDKIVGIFHGFSEGGLEFRADIVLPYKNIFQSVPMHGQFLLVQLEHDQEAILGRITSISSAGRLASEPGQDYGIRAVRDRRPVPEDLREDYLRYHVAIRVLGLLRVVNGTLEFAASHRRLPHVGSRVAFLSDEVLREVAGHNIDGAEMGWFSLGEFVYAAGDARLKPEAWMKVVSPLVVPKFDVGSLVKRRTFVFARAGFGKSNLVKLLFANLYSGNPTVPKRDGQQKAVGAVIFDPDGEYFWPDDKGLPGLCDVPALKEKIVVFTAKEAPSGFYQSFVAGGVKLDIRRLRAADVVSVALSPEKQDQQNVRKLKTLNDTKWAKLVDEIYAHGNAADDATVADLLGLKEDQEAEMYAARANMTTIVGMLHDPSSTTMDKLLVALREGKLCIVDVSQARGEASLQLSGLLLKKIFDHNMGEFTKKDPDSIPVIAVVEEAQSVLSERMASGEGIYVQWVKEGRKLDLGAVLVTQQPGSIAWQILSQGDNWFIFHLLSAGDLEHVRKANSHFSEDILSSLLNEPIPGQGVYWSSAGAKPKQYPISLRVLLFQDAYQRADPKYERPPEPTYAGLLREKYDKIVKEAAKFAAQHEGGGSAASTPPVGEAAEGETGPDILTFYTQKAATLISADATFISKLKKDGVTWAGVKQAIYNTLPDVLDSEERDSLAYRLVKPVLDSIFGPQDEGWKSQRKPRRSGEGSTVWVVAKRTEDSGTS